jgi:hypothetical protein
MLARASSFEPASHRSTRYLRATQLPCFAEMAPWQLPSIQMNAAPKLQV